MNAIQGNPDDASTDYSQGSADRASVESPSSKSSSSRLGKVFKHLPTPDRHLITMFGIGISAAVLMLIAMPFYFHGTSDVDTQPPRNAQYRVDINCPRWAEFANLPMIGEKTAQSIVQHGQEIGGFRSIDQLLEVKGIGGKTLAKIRPFLVNKNENAIAQQPQATNN